MLNGLFLSLRAISLKYVIIFRFLFYFLWVTYLGDTRTFFVVKCNRRQAFSSNHKSGLLVLSLWLSLCVAYLLNTLNPKGIWADFLCDCCVCLLNSSVKFVLRVLTHRYLFIFYVGVFVSVPYYHGSKYSRYSTFTEGILSPH